MPLDWNVVSSIATAFASIATAIGVAFCGIQLKLTKKQSQAEFEDRLDQQYREISMALPVDVLIGQDAEEEKAGEIRELIYNYLDLTNEQVYLRAKGRVSNHTWSSWSSGIEAHMKKKAFTEVFDEIKDFSAFTYLERLVKDRFKSDPAHWYK